MIELTQFTYGIVWALRDDLEQRKSELVTAPVFVNPAAILAVGQGPQEAAMPRTLVYLSSREHLAVAETPLAVMQLVARAREHRSGSRG